MREMGELIEATKTLVGKAIRLREEIGDFHEPEFMSVIDNLNYFVKN